MGRIIRVTSSFVRPADNTAYQAGDEVSNHATAASVVRPVFDFRGFTRGRLLGAAIDVTPASGNVVITAFDLQLILFKTAQVPAAVGDNVTHPIAGTTRRNAISHFRFDDGAWTNPLGAVTASTSAYQEVPATLSLPTGTPALVLSPAGGIFDFGGGEAPTMTAVLQILGAWTPTGIANTFGITLYAEVE